VDKMTIPTVSKRGHDSESCLTDIVITTMELNSKDVPHHFPLRSIERNGRRIVETRWYHAIMRPFIGRFFNLNKGENYGH
jgi:hypothetical protein